MNLLKTYDKNKKKHLLKEVSATGHAGSFVGQKGDYVDRKFSGGFNPVFGELEKLLDNQVNSDIMKRMYTDDITPESDQDFIDMEWEYHYDENEKIDNSKFKNTSGKDQLVDLDIKYDKIIDKTEENKKFVNDTNNWKSIYDNKKY